MSSSVKVYVYAGDESNELIHAQHVLDLVTKFHLSSANDVTALNISYFVSILCG